VLGYHWLAAKATPSGSLALRALDAHSEPDGSRTSPKRLRRQRLPARPML